MMTAFYILGTLLILFYLLKNIHSYSEYKRYSQQAIAVFDDTRKSHKVIRTLFTLGFVAALIFIPIALFVLKIRQPDLLMCILCLALGCALFAFYPFTPGRWVITEHGIYIYNNNVFLPWGQIIGTEIVPRGKKTFIIINLKQTEKEHMKRTSYPVMAPGPKAKDICNMIREFVNMLERKRYRKQINEERSIPLKDRKFY